MIASQLKSCGARLAALSALMQALRRDVRGNTLIIVAFSLIPLLGMIGSAVDMSRGYMAQTRLQQACDAGALAGRRIMQGDVFNASVQAEATKFFNFNFPQKTFQTNAFTPQVDRPELGTVRVRATTTIPTTIMRLFGFQTLPLGVECTASQDIVNTDILLVLDVTGSMAWKPNGDPCGQGCNAATQTRLAGLKSAVMALYDELKPMQDQLAAAGLRLRYGVLPYSQTVNVGKLLWAKDQSYVRNPAEYRQKGECNNWQYYNDRWRCGGYAYPLTSVTHSSTWLQDWASTASGKEDRGCIEERATTPFAANATTIPTTAYDLDLNLIPYSDDTKWAPWDDDAEEVGSGECPAPARRLATWSRDGLQTYINSLTAVGATYHDIGVIWGGRLISSSGVFADSPTTYLNMKVNKYVIFMTDGELAPSAGTYSAYGVENYDRRITGTASDLTARHQRRFEVACDRVKALGATVFVVGFSTSLDDIKSCASGDDLAELASSNAELTELFQGIGKKIGALRLTK